MIDGRELQGILGVMVPIVAIVGGISLAFGSIYLKSRERLEMINRGMDVSALNQPWPKRKRSPLRGGLMFFSAGIGLLIAYVLCHTVLTGEDNEVIYFGFVATFVGLGLIISHLFEKKEPDDTTNQQ